MSETNTTGGASKEPQRPAGLKKDSIWEVYWPRDVHADKAAVPVASFPMIIYFWPTMLTFFLLALAQGVFGASPTSIGLTAVALWAANLLVIVTDLDQKKFVIFVLLLVLLGLGAWVSTLKEWSFLRWLGDWVRGLDLQFSTQALFAMASLILFFLLVGLAHPRLNYWRFEANEFVHYVQPWGRDQSIPRQGSTVTREIPDVMEMLLTFGGGSLVVRREGQVVARIRHVPFLTRRMIALEKLLSATRVQSVS